MPHRNQTSLTSPNHHGGSSSPPIDSLGAGSSSSSGVPVQRRTVRMLSQLPEDGSSSSDDEDALNLHPVDYATEREADDVTPRHFRQASSSNPQLPNTTPTRLTSMSNTPMAIPKLVRASTSGASSSRSSLGVNGAGLSPASNGMTPPMQGSSYRRNRFNLRRNPSSKSSVSSGAASVREERVGYQRRGLMDLMDPDSPYHDNRRLNHLDDWNSDDDDDELRLGLAHTSLSTGTGVISPNHSDTSVHPPLMNSSSLIPAALPPPEASLDETAIHDRKGWQSFLASVLSGDVLQGESVRIGEERGVDETVRHEFSNNLWWQIRAKVRRRTEEDERQRTMERRARLVDRVLEEVDAFTVRRSPGPPGLDRRLSSESMEEEGDEEDGPESEAGALDQVNYVLQKLALVESLYPTWSAIRVAKPLYDAEEFQAKVDALSAWSTIVTALQAQLATLQKWTGSDDLDITKPNTTKEKALVGKNRYHPLDGKAVTSALGDQAADDSTFLERVMKEDSLDQTFERKRFKDLDLLLKNVKNTVILHSQQFHSLKLPDFTFELVRLIGFPGKLIIEVLKVRLDAAKRLSDPNSMVVDDMVGNFKLILEIAVATKRSYLNITAADDEKRWNIPDCLPPEYDSVLLDGLKAFFRLLTFKLRSSDRNMYLREVEVLESHADFLQQVAEFIPGGDLVVVESFCSLTNRLINRICTSFERQTRIPLPLNSPSMAHKAVTDLRTERNPVPKEDRKRMNIEEMLGWYSKILDAVRMRYRKLQRFARRLTLRYDNSAEYLLEPEEVKEFFQQMQDSGHILLHTNDRPEGVYILAHESLRDKPETIAHIYKKAFSVPPPVAPPSRPSLSRRVSEVRDPGVIEMGPELYPEEGSEEITIDFPGYLLVVSTMTPLMWTGPIIYYEDGELAYIDMELAENRIRLIADGSTARLTLCKQIFLDSMLDDEGEEMIMPPECIVQGRAHLPRVQRQLERIAKSNYRLTESFIESAALVRHTLGGAPGTQDMIESWFQFAAENGKRFAAHVEQAVQVRFIRLLMRLAVNWCSFICDSCDPTQRKTFRWTVTALRMTFQVTDGDNILQLEPEEFENLKKSVASLISLLISHFDILGARGTMEAKRESEKIEAMRRIQRAQENIEDFIFPRGTSPSGEPRAVTDRSLRMVQEDRMRLLAELEAAREDVTTDQHLVGQVLDEQVSEDRALVFLAASSSNIALKWQQGALIGQGANGDVYLGFNLDSGGVMAVKEIKVQMNNSAQLYEKIKDESDVMSRLRHQNIVEYYGIEVHRDRVFIFQEYCAGGSLADQLEHGRVEEEDIIKWYAYQMLHGLEYLHSKGIEHRDVKPGNILTDEFNSVLKFVDFGAAKIVIHGNRTLAKTRAVRAKAVGVDGAAVMASLNGTPMYMAPEVIRAQGGGRLGAADIWSMGCVLLEMSTGRKPWSNLDNEWAIMFHIGIAEQHPPLPEHGELSEAGIAFIEQCLTLDPSERPTAKELLEDEWILPLIEQLKHEQEHGEATSPGGGPSTSSTMVDDNDPYAKQLAQITQRPHNNNDDSPSLDFTSLSNTPLDPTPPPPDVPPEV